ncbi:MAG TPA: gluconokinase [Thermomicrobiales bacterium]|nr:gluconokinase [Thermomicrobiales bacterium]
MSSPFSESSADVFALAIDIGSSSVRALLFNSKGDQVPGSEVQLPYRQTVTPDGGSESSATELRDRVVACVDGVLNCQAAQSGAIVAVGMTSFWHGLLGLDSDHQPATPVYMWSDKRSGHEAEHLASELGMREVHARTGCRLHSSYWPAKLRWLEDHDCDMFVQVRYWVSITDYVMYDLTGTLQTSVSMASGTGLLNANSLQWDEDLREHLGLKSPVLPSIVDRSDAYSSPHPAFRNRWPALENVPWYPAIGDGAAANVGSGCVTPNRIAMTIGTSAAMRVVLAASADTSPIVVPERIWQYRLDRDHAVVGGALSNGGNVAAWIAEHSEMASIAKLSTAAAMIPPDGHGLTILPMLAGERSPSWNEHASGTFQGIRLATTSADLFRATLEASAYRLASIYDDLLPLATFPFEIHANGAAALGSPLWLQIIADTLGHRIDAVDAETEASARGAAICALQAVGAIDTLLDTGRPVATSYDPNPANYDIHAAARSRQAALEVAISQL